MADDDDVHALLEAAYRTDKMPITIVSSDSDRDRTADKKSRKNRSRSRSPTDRHSNKLPSKDKERDREKERDRDRYNRERDNRRGGDSEKEKISSMGRLYAPVPGKSASAKQNNRSPSPRTPREDLTAEERDARTVFCMQLAARCRRHDLIDFFKPAGEVHDVKLITDFKTGKSKGLAYVEFEEPKMAQAALTFAGKKLLGVPIVVQPSMAEKNRLAAMTAAATGTTYNTKTPHHLGTYGNQSTAGHVKLYIGNLHVNISESMLRSIMEPFGTVEHLNIVQDDAGRSKGYGFVTFRTGESAQKAMQQLNGFEVAGRNLKVSFVTERGLSSAVGPIGAADNSMGPSLDTDEIDRTGVGLGARGRIQLMAKLAEGTGMQLPKSAQNVLNQPAPGSGYGAAPQQTANTGAPIATPCFMLSNMFDPQAETEHGWDVEIREDVIDECNKHGGVLHLFVDPNSQGNVYCKCPTVAAANAAVNALHGRWFGGKTITAAYVPMPIYHDLFPDSLNCSALLQPSSGGY